MIAQINQRIDSVRRCRSSLPVAGDARGVMGGGLDGRGPSAGARTGFPQALQKF